MIRPSVSFIAWAPSAGRARDLAAELGGEYRCFYPQSLTSRRLVPLRYAASSVGMAAYLVRRRPRAVVVQNPPVYPGLVALAYARAVRGRFVLDAHPTAFGAKDNKQARMMIRWTRFLARHAAVVLVTTQQWVNEVNSWGGTGLVVHEAPPEWSIATKSSPADQRPRVLFVCVFASDEPVAEVLDAARQLPELDIRITGDPSRAEPGLLADLPTNVTLTGWLEFSDYAREVEAADIILALTTEPSSVQRAAYESVYARRVLVISDWSESRTLFPHATVTANTTDSLAHTLRMAAEHLDELGAGVEDALQVQKDRWSTQRQALRAVLENQS